MDLELRYPMMVVLLVPASLLVYLFAKQIRKSRTPEKVAVLSLRSLIFFLVIAALSIPQILLPIRAEHIIFLVDRSASFEDKQDEILDWLDKSVEGKRGEQLFSIASFADGAVIDQSPSTKKSAIGDLTGKLNTGETNMEEGITLAASLLSAEQGGRIVLMTDGNETAGAGKEAAKLLKNWKLELDYVQLGQSFREDAALSKLEVPPALYEGEQAIITVAVSSNMEKMANLIISLNNKDILHEPIAVKEGRNEFTFVYQVKEPGMAVFKAELAVKDDAFIENNSLYAVTNVKGTPKILVVQGNQDDALTEILQTAGFITDELVPEKLPTTLAGMLQYQSIIFNNVSGTRVSEQQMTLIEKAVKEFGTGFVMLGGEDSFGLGGYFKTPIEKLLPVDMDIKGKKELPSLGLVIVIDRSGSMSGNKLTLAKEAAARSVELLREKDTLGFIAFDDRPWVILETAPLANKEKAVEKIRSVSVGGGTNIFPSLEMAYQELQDLKLQRKHIILLTDGQSAAGGDYQALIAEGKQDNITLSTVALGTDADRRLLEDLAQQGSGRFYDVTDASVIPSILSRETVMTTTRTYIEDNPFYPAVQPYPEWTALFKKGVPKMNAYIAVTAKNRAQVPLISEKEDPILAQWQYGLGTTLAFTSDMTGKWSGDWAQWPEWPQFINQLVTESLPQYDSEDFRYSVGKENSNTIISLKGAEGQFLPLEISVVSQEGTVMDARVKPTAPGEYEVIFPNKPGMYFLRTKQTTEDGQERLFQTGFSVPYSEEYLLKGNNDELLKELMDISGGKRLASPQEAFRPLTEQPMRKLPISEALLLVAFLLLVLEITIRRLGFKPFYLMAGIAKKGGKHREDNATTTIGELATKNNNLRARTDTLGTVKEEHVPEMNSEPKKPRPTPTEQKKNAPALSIEEKEARLKRLLDAKKRKQ